MRAYTQEHTAVFNRHAAQHDFTGAERLLALLRSLQTHFPDKDLVDLEGLEATLQTARAQYAAQQEAKEERDRVRREREAMEARIRRREA
jgi:hypothetical protein